GGVACYTNSAMKTSNCFIYNNVASDNGGGIFLNHSTGRIENCLFYENVSNGGSSAIDCWSSDPIINNCTFFNNVSYGWATIGIWDTSNPIIFNCIVSYNTGSGFVFHSQSQATVEYCDCYNNSSGSFSGYVPAGLDTLVQMNANGDPCDAFYNIFLDPEFIDFYTSEFNLSQNSPCIDAGIPDTTGLNLPQFDMNGNPRVVDGNGDGLAIIDMGCYEFYNYLQPIRLAIPAIHALPGDTVLVPMNVQFPQDSTFTSAEIQVGGYLGSLEFVELFADSSLVGDAGWLYESYETDSINTMWMAGSEPISGEDVLIWMKFIIPDTAAGFIPITLVNAIFDTGILPVDLHSGGINVVTPIYGDVDFNGLVQAYDASMILKYLAGYIFLDDLQLSVADVSLDSTVSALDATLILQYGVGIIDTLPYEPGPEYLASGDITMEDAVYVGTPIEVPIYLTNSDKIYSFEGLISFDPQLLTLLGISWSGYLDGFDIQSHVNDGECRIIGSEIESYNQNGIFATLVFQANDGFTSCDSTFVSFDRLRLNENDIMYNVDRVKVTKDFGIINPQEQQFMLHQNTPNPFAYNTKIQYSIPMASFISLKIYNIRGELVADLIDEFKTKGSYDVSWDGKDTYGKSVVNGMYFYKFNSSDKEIVKRMILLR
ncbi:MAG: cohesin domain-containing protein, partial [Candidatus Electryonea clarkiae]|nr:cohesin domain-containing protein [Candidatus Electryonea clarkiae]